MCMCMLYSHHTSLISPHTDPGSFPVISVQFVFCTQVMMASLNPVEAQIHHAECLGLVDDQLSAMYELKPYNDTYFFFNLIQQFLSDAPARFRNIEALLMNGVVVDFRVLDVEAATMYGCAASVGAAHVRKACINMRQATSIHSKEGCLEAFNDAKREYAVLGPHFDALLQLEWNFILNGNRF